MIAMQGGMGICTCGTKTGDLRIVTAQVKVEKINKI